MCGVLDRTLLKGVSILSTLINISYCNADSYSFLTDFSIKSTLELLYCIASESMLFIIKCVASAYFGEVYVLIHLATQS